MSNAINPRDVLLYLNELGYTNITAQQLKAFIKDLKKLVKYEQRLENKENDQSRSFNHEDVYSILHSTTTIASKGKEVQKKGNTITVEVKKISKENGQMTVGSELVNKESGFSDQCCCNQENKQEDISENVSADSVRRSKSCGKLSAKSVVSKPNIKAKASFIRPKTAVKASRSDPVTLYHQYKAEWEKQKFPGEDNRAELRWAIREKMLGDHGSRPASTAPSMTTVSKKKINFKT